MGLDKILTVSKPSPCCVCRKWFYISSVIIGVAEKAHLLKMETTSSENFLLKIQKSDVVFVCQEGLTDAIFLGKKKEAYRQDIQINSSNSWYLNVPFQV